ncbi:MAG: xanthine dehydrogenase family protein molybdopterin-binding subunit [Anaerolineae bacterium]|nr:xanthine dehydrogenase family protein molybdopterin-binding subunit [Anaerolineae bacterium]
MKAEYKQRQASTLSRRKFLKVSVAAGAGLTLGIYLSGCQGSPTPTPPPTSPPAPAAIPEEAGLLEPNVYLTVDRRGIATIRSFRSEMGQGIRTAMAMIVAEELDVEWPAVRIEQSPTDPAYGNQVTGGSVSISQHYSILRQAGGAARQMLVTAAANRWRVEAKSCRTESGEVIHPDGEQRLSYGALVDAAAELPIPAQREVQLKDPQDFRIIGTPVPLYDAPQMVKGSAIYGSDVSVPNMLYATVARCPEFGGKVGSFEAASARAVAGVHDVIQIDSGIAVVADDTWAAIQGRAVLDITWQEGSYADWDSASIRQLLAKNAPQPGEAAADGGAALDAAYDIPYLAHATMEPMTCVADMRADRCEVWAPTQDPQAAKRRVGFITGLPQEAIIIHVPHLGGGFGRRLEVDYVVEAVQISQAVDAPIKLVWTREDDIQHDFYHPLSYNYVRAELDDTGRPAAMPGVRSHPMLFGVPTGYWRSIEHFTEAFARESFLDEIAARNNLDPHELRRELLPARASAVVDLAAAQAGWGSPLPEGWGRGIAYYATHGATHVAQVAEVSVAPDGAVRVHRVVCAVDCGTVVNPDTVKAQMEGGIVFGLTAALKAGITIKAGRTEQSNFHDYPLLRMDEMPVVEVHIVPSDEDPSGIGEMGVPPIAPAVANAIFAATGKRLRRLPIRAEDLRGA